MTHPSHWRREPTTYRALFFILKWLILRFNDKTYWNHSFITLQLLWNFYKAEKTYWTEPWTKCFSLDERDWWSPTNQEVFWLFIMLILLMHFEYFPSWCCFKILWNEFWHDPIVHFYSFTEIEKLKTKSYFLKERVVFKLKQILI